MKLTLLIICLFMSLSAQTADGLKVNVEVGKGGGGFNLNRAFELAIPAGLGSGLTVLGVLLTTWANARENARNRSSAIQQLRFKNNLDTLHRCLEEVVTSIHQYRECLCLMESTNSMLKLLDENGDVRPRAARDYEEARSSLMVAAGAMGNAMAKARFRLSDDFMSVAISCQEEARRLHGFVYADNSLKFNEALSVFNKAFDQLIAQSKTELERIENL